MLIRISLLSMTAFCLALLGAPVPTAAEEPQYSSEKDAAAITLKTPDGKPILRYVIGKLPDDEQPQTSVPVVGYLHPVYTPSGAVLTESGHKGGDHTWLRGVFLAWPQVGGDKPAGFWTCGKAVWKEKGRIVNRSASTEADAKGAALSATNAWTDGQSDVLVEKTQVRAFADSGAYVIDVTTELSAADGPVKLLPWAFAGLAFHGRRIAGESAAFYSPDGAVNRAEPQWNNPKNNWPDAAWYDLVLAGKDGRSCGLAMMAHPGNGKCTWQAYRGLRMLNPNVTATEALTVEKTKPLILRHRLVAHDGSSPADVLNRLAAEFGKQWTRSSY
ncbi:MAG: DUF6807 family protein [Thermoguttaceae bacterium]